MMGHATQTVYITCGGPALYGHSGRDEMMDGDGNHGKGTGKANWRIGDVVYGYVFFKATHQERASERASLFLSIHAS